MCSRELGGTRLDVTRKLGTGGDLRPQPPNQPPRRYCQPRRPIVRNFWKEWLLEQDSNLRPAD